MRRGQAALEFLTTYAWAFLVVLIMIGALAYFGILNPIKLLPDRCLFGTTISCEDHVAAWGTDGTDGTMTLRLKNGVGEAITVTAYELTNEADAVIACNPLAPSSPPPYGTGEIWNQGFDTCPWGAASFQEDAKEKITVTISYYAQKSGVAFTRQVEGEVFTVMQ